MATMEASLHETPHKPIWKDPVFWFVIVLGVGYGAVYNFLPASFPIFYREFGTSLKQMGQAQFIFFISCLVFSVVGGPAIAAIGLKRSAMFALALAGVVLIVIGGAHEFSVVLLCAGLFGFSIIALVVIENSIVSGHFREKRQSVFFITSLSDSGGSMIGPAMLGWWFVQAEHWQMSWRLGYFVAAGVMVFLFVWALFMRRDSMPGDSFKPDTPGDGLSVIKSVLRVPAFYVVVLLEFCHGIGQAGVISFMGQLYVSKLHIDPGHAAYLLSLNAAGILCGRLMLSWITMRWPIPELVVIGVCAVGETAAFLGAILSPSLFCRSHQLCAGWSLCFSCWSIIKFLPGRKIPPLHCDCIFSVCRPGKCGRRGGPISYRHYRKSFRSADRNPVRTVVYRAAQRHGSLLVHARKACDQPGDLAST